ncbi:MAG TPA: hypothetical protein VK914_00775 [bacterium]|nr:hypothetical protein [bacterium]
MDLTRESFAPHLNERFHVRPAGGEGSPVELLLVEVSGTSQGGLDTCSLLFKGPREGVFPHDTHAVNHPALGDLDLFLGPVHSPGKDGVYYQAVLTRIRA